ncbi:bifunctional phosphopantothenoylcysteine decarboxylase/phosphopantothenate--cysteine ligase CoaBC [Legionella israelensis]|uniref:bifunctional phosphopantothenoylcysteine decarboxylase/phosphopantothenate--cysteine ligase CoaBC n=1 Tax=Legionella israelensis TaxID=454 RepID=UPI00117D0D05|nr:bifunctional phosphopantothenoylcysteine decarboxylase/phosphopantothenate--cysteine ligase CoaBC [Legionella israelensis]QDP71896.1 bifunctional phosphopantothenoylcysteine decarboxylase/phosphopantothenate--cysteine ligase CoaBC [Legionella israelensis]
MQDFRNKKVLVGVCGGIAAYKSAFLVRELTRAGAEVRVVMTKSAQEFITPLTFQALSGHDVRCELFDAQAERAMGHIELARWADYLLIAPATANVLAKMAQGIADDLLSTLYLVAEIPVIVCPAMNRSMWAHPSTRLNCEQLLSRGVIFMGPGEGSQACGDEGLGRLSELEHILNALRLCDVSQLLTGQQVLITAGPTREPVDPVRYLTNRSSGKMGYALAQAAAIAGAEVVLISGPSEQLPPEHVKLIPVETAQNMYEAVMEHLQSSMIFIGAAAVADYHCVQPANEKMKKSQRSSMSLEFALNPDILAEVAASGKAFTVGFAAETEHVLTYARKKLKQKKLDMIIANQVGENLGFDRDENKVTVLTPKNQIELPEEHKVRIAGKIIAIIAASLQNDA